MKKKKLFNKRNVIILLILFLVIIGIAYYLFPIYKQFQLHPAEYRQCSVSEDCMIDQMPFCIHCGCWSGMRLAVNKQSYKEKNCSGVVCATALSNHWSCKKRKAECVLGQCILTYRFT